MRIEELLPPPQPGKPWSVALEGGEVLRVSESVVASFALYGGMELEAETLTALQEAAALAAWREKAGRLLTARMLSSGQLAEKLTAKGATEEQAAQVVAWAQDIGLLDDSAYAKALARHYTAKGYGPYKIKDEFYRRQVPREDWEEALAAVEPPEAWMADFLSRKIQDPEGPCPDQESLRRPGAPGLFLAYRVPGGDPVSQRDRPLVTGEETTMKVGFISLGCAKNQVNCEQMIWKTYEAGYEVALGAEDCDVAVVNTCGFLQEAREEALAEIDALAQAKAQGKLQKILVTGCMAQWWKDEIQARCPQADGFVGVSGYEDIAQVIAQALEDQHPAHFGDIDAPVPETDRVVCTSDYWAWLRIAEGCDNRCAYCIIPFIRGKFRSRPEEAILAEAQDLAQAGMQELIVVAQDITRYGLDLYGARTLAKLLPKLCAIEGIHWVRLHYLYPDEITDELIDVIANEPKIVKYLDIPIQHISDHLLKSMHRRGTGEEIRALFRKLRERIPGLVLRTSLIAGFPGETEEDFEELCTFLREFRIQRAGVFPFSPEEGSAAATYPDQVDEDVKRRRVELITELQMAVVDDWCESMMGQVVEVICEGYDDETELYYGRSYADSPGIDGLVHFEGEEGGVRPGAFYQVKITSNYDGELIGILYEEDEEP